MSVSGYLRLLRPPRFPDEEQNAASDLIIGAGWALFPISIAVALVAILTLRSGATRPILLLLGLMLVSATGLILAYRGKTKAGGLVMPVAAWSLITLAVSLTGGLHSPHIWFYPFTIFFAGFARGIRAGFAVAILCFATSVAFAAGILPYASPQISDLRIWLAELLGILIAASFQAIAADSLRHALRRAGRELADRERAEQDLAEMVRESGDGVGTIDAMGNSLVANPALERIFGADPGKLAGRNIMEFLRPEGKRVVVEQMQRRRKGETSRYQVDIIRMDGLRRTIHVTATPRFDTAGTFIGAVTMVRDVTDPQSLEGQIRLLAHALASAGECIWVADPADGRLLYVNDATERTFGYERGSLLGENSSVLIADGLASAVQGILAGQKLSEGWHGEVWCKARDGREFPMEVTTSRVREGHGAGAWVCVGHDVTQERQAEAVLRESERRFREHLKRVQLLAVMIDRNGSVTFCNDFFLNVTGWLREDVVGQPALRFVASEDRQRAGAGFDVLRERARLPRTAENIIVTRTGKKRLIQWHNTPLLDHAGALTGFCGLGVDITEHRALMDHQQQSERLESVGRLAAGVAHDFNNLLTVINGYSHLSLQRMLPGDPQRKALEEIHKAGEQATAITRQLLTFSRRQVIQPGPVALNDVILESETMFRQLLGGRIRLVSSLAPGLGCILADKGQLQQVLINLMTNAMHAMPEGGVIQVETALASHPEGKSGDWVLLRVSDNGEGMDHETLSHIFEPFFTTRTDGKGTGLGLSIVYGIVRQSNGDLTAESLPGMGTTFRIWWPRAAAPVERADVEAARPQRGSETILVAEDREDVRELVTAMLRRAGYQVLAAPGGEEALRMVEQAGPAVDLLLSDVVMPGMNGRELAGQLMARSPRLKVILMSGYAADIVDWATLPAAGIAFLQKPLVHDVLTQKVREMLDSR